MTTPTPRTDAVRARHAARSAMRGYTDAVDFADAADLADALERDGCPGEIARIGDAMLRREERAHERGDRDERLAEWDRGVGP